MINFIAMIKENVIIKSGVLRASFKVPTIFEAKISKQIDSNTHKRIGEGNNRKLEKTICA